MKSIILFVLGVFVLFFSPYCFGQTDSDVKSEADDAMRDAERNNTRENFDEEDQNERRIEEEKKMKEKAEEKKKTEKAKEGETTEEETEEGIEEVSPPADEASLEGWEESGPSTGDFYLKNNNAPIWGDNQGFIDR